MALRILIADDHRIFRKGLRNIISTFHDMEVVGEAINGAEALYLTDAEKPDILLLDINMPILNGIEVLEEMAKRNLSTKALMISMHEDSMHMLKCLKAGACGYLSYAGDMDVAIAIRTGIIKDQTLYVQAAAGVVADSVPEMEWRETEHKARALLRAAELVEEGLE